MVKTAFLFPGQGSQYIGMGKNLLALSPSVATIFEKADAICGFPLSTFMFEGPEDKLKDTSVTQPALFVASAAAFHVLKERGIQASLMAGHSLGEYSALHAAGAIPFDEALRLVMARGKAMQEAAQTHPGAMAAILGLNPAVIKDICAAIAASGEICAAANFNSESQTVIAGSVNGVNLAVEKAKAAGAAKAIVLNVSGAFHSPLMSQAVQTMEPLINTAPFSKTATPVVTNVDAKPTTEPGEIKKKLVQQIDHPVLWDDSLKAMLAQGIELFIEVGAGKVLSSMIKKLDRTKTVLWTDDFESIEKMKETLCV